MNSSDIIMAFFPCTMFQQNNALWFTGKAHNIVSYTQEEKIEIMIERHKKLDEYYELINMLASVCLRKDLKLIIENPATKPHYLLSYWFEPTFIDKDRTKDGDYYKKPTAYWFINCKPESNLVFEPIEYVEQKFINRVSVDDFGTDRTVARSMIHPQYARRFIKRYILTDKKVWADYA